ncbi:MAG: hypothetical protein HZT40_16800 [Candidatus Thiothrix singaporensis]|uniref:Uncharacterized protein n=1 Tax=Candidatus Thiothrix singaporensis TaxID=2799669 RepID=A0A7L6AV44_9GAMM|nr:MAG: hypothetical protein HZT40_16800 [Candidatus Thiothrix singaporensis]
MLVIHNIDITLTTQQTAVAFDHGGCKRPPLVSLPRHPQIAPVLPTAASREGTVSPAHRYQQSIPY